MCLYEFTFIAQHSMLHQEVEEMIQELNMMLKNIKNNIILQQIDNIIREGNNELAKHESLSHACSVQKSLVDYSSFLEFFTKILWIELENDLSNLKEIKSKVDKEINNNLKVLWRAQDFIQFAESNKQIAKFAFIRNTVNSFKKGILRQITNIIQEVLQKDRKIICYNKFNKMLNSLLSSIGASGLIKYEYWGLLEFAYPIGKMKSGHYCIMCITSTFNIMNEFVRKVKLNENIIRHLSIRVKKFFEGKSHMMNKQIEGQGS